MQCTPGATNKRQQPSSRLAALEAACLLAPATKSNGTQATSPSRALIRETIALGTQDSNLRRSWVLGRRVSSASSESSSSTTSQRSSQPCKPGPPQSSSRVPLNKTPRKSPSLTNAIKGNKSAYLGFPSNTTWVASSPQEAKPEDPPVPLTRFVEKSSKKNDQKRRSASNVNPSTSNDWVVTNVTHSIPTTVMTPRFRHNRQPSDPYVLVLPTTPTKVIRNGSPQGARDSPKMIRAATSEGSFISEVKCTDQGTIHLTPSIQANLSRLEETREATELSEDLKPIIELSADVPKLLSSIDREVYRPSQDVYRTCLEPPPLRRLPSPETVREPMVQQHGAPQIVQQSIPPAVQQGVPQLAQQSMVSHQQPKPLPPPMFQHVVSQQTVPQHGVSPCALPQLPVPLKTLSQPPVMQQTPQPVQQSIYQPVRDIQTLTSAPSMRTTEPVTAPGDLTPTSRSASYCWPRDRSSIIPKPSSESPSLTPSPLKALSADRQGYPPRDLSRLFCELLDNSCSACNPEGCSIPFLFHLAALLNEVQSQETWSSMAIANELVKAVCRESDGSYARAPIDIQMRRSYLIYETFAVALTSAFSGVTSSITPRYVSCFSTFLHATSVKHWKVPISFPDPDASLNQVCSFIDSHRTFLVCHFLKATQGLPAYQAHIPHLGKIIEMLIFYGPESSQSSLVGFLVASRAHFTLLAALEIPGNCDLLLSLLGVIYQAPPSLSQLTAHITNALEHQSFSTFGSQRARTFTSGGLVTPVRSFLSLKEELEETKKSSMINFYKAITLALRDTLLRTRAHKSTHTTHRYRLLLACNSPPKHRKPRLKTITIGDTASLTEGTMASTQARASSENLCIQATETAKVCGDKEKKGEDTSSVNSSPKSHGTSLLRTGCNKAEAGPDFDTPLNTSAEECYGPMTHLEEDICITSQTETQEVPSLDARLSISDSVSGHSRRQEWVSWSGDDDSSSRSLSMEMELREDFYKAWVVGDTKHKRRRLDHALSRERRRSSAVSLPDVQSEDEDCFACFHRRRAQSVDAVILPRRKACAMLTGIYKLQDDDLFRNEAAFASFGKDHKLSSESNDYVQDSPWDQHASRSLIESCEIQIMTAAEVVPLHSRPASEGLLGSEQRVTNAFEHMRKAFGSSFDDSNVVSSSEDIEPLLQPCKEAGAQIVKGMKLLCSPSGASRKGLLRVRWRPRHNYDPEAQLASPRLINLCQFLLRLLDGSLAILSNVPVNNTADPDELKSPVPMQEMPPLTSFANLNTRHHPQLALLQRVFTPDLVKQICEILIPNVGGYQNVIARHAVQRLNGRRSRSATEPAVHLKTSSAVFPCAPSISSSSTSPSTTPTLPSLPPSRTMLNTFGLFGSTRLQHRIVQRPRTLCERLQHRSVFVDPTSYLLNAQAALSVLLQLATALTLPAIALSWSTIKGSLVTSAVPSIEIFLQTAIVYVKRVPLHILRRDRIALQTNPTSTPPTLASRLPAKCMECINLALSVLIILEIETKHPPLNMNPLNATDMNCGEKKYPTHPITQSLSSQTIRILKLLLTSVHHSWDLARIRSSRLLSETVKRLDVRSLHILKCTRFMTVIMKRVEDFLKGADSLGALNNHRGIDSRMTSPLTDFLINVLALCNVDSRVASIMTMYPSWSILEPKLK
eukprot:Blabericola_migrator_1__2801@NODE_17_length_22983_cov_74_609923_g14_i0_p1_GENE_NODE_17_length_22983_cov_74_609923_g14_i0NODE_17_length_22983_cov_74_609923_g14_i0_p1_ORF_typecomplete_len1650_score224_44_NODE_17_length_22983_cov_74_609923_g14_i025507499